MSGTIENTLAAALDGRWRTYRTQLKLCRQELSEPAVHDLRVSARRMLAALDVAAASEPRLRVRKPRRAIKALLDDLDDLRDAQVTYMEASKTEGVPEVLVAFQSYLRQREARFRLEARQGMRLLKRASTRKRVRRIRSALAGPSQPARFSESLLGAIDSIYARAQHAAAQVDAREGPSIHKARIAFKRFRYSVEIVEPILPAHALDYFKRMHAHQTALGDIRDIEVFLAALADFASTLPPTEASNEQESQIARVRLAHEQHHTQLVAAYLENRDELRTFWRAAPNRSFPWEMNNDPLRLPPRDCGRDGRPGELLGRQSAPADQQGAPEDAQDRTGVPAA